MGKNLAQRKLKVTCAESCTGGGIAYLLTSVAGSSRWLDKAWTTYAVSAKAREFGINVAYIEEHGVVSPETAAAMARGALQQADAHLAIATTGIAGPGGAEEGKPVGTVDFGFAIRISTGIETFSWRKVFTGNRLEIREAAILEAFNYLYQSVMAPITKCDKIIR